MNTTDKTYLCQAWGETDLPCADIVEGLDAVRAFLVREWLGSDDATDYDGTPTLTPIMDELAARDWRGDGAWSAEFEIGGVSVELTSTGPTFQQRVQPWMQACFGEVIAADREERNHRFLEEALELVQSTGCTSSEAHQLVDYVFRRTVGEPAQEVGGVMVTLAALCLANGMDMHKAGEVELARIWTKLEAIRAKQAAKPKHSPLPA